MYYPDAAAVHLLPAENPGRNRQLAALPVLLVIGLVAQFIQTEMVKKASSWTCDVRSIQIL
jgi:hypothetical protein